MSSETDANPINIDSVDVNSLLKENVKDSENTGDSGLESGDSCSATLPSFPETEVFSIKDTENNILVELNNGTASDDISSLTSRTSVSPDANVATNNFFNFNELPAESSDLISSNLENSNDYKNDPVMPNNDEVISSTDNVEHTGKLTSESNDGLQHIGQFLPESSEFSTQFCIETSNIENRNLATSTTSLNEQIVTDNIITALCKSSYSRSADNISNIEQNVQTNLNCSSKELNTEKILTDFQTQKNVAAATQKIPQEPPKNVPETHNIDLKYARLPKELLPQDLGSLVKNVHGIFSSVSGSLKFAYNQTQRAPKPPIKSMPRLITNGKVMDDIFEDQMEKISVQINQNSMEKSTANHSPQNIEEKQNQHVKELNENNNEKEGENDTKTDVLKLQIESLERVLAEQRRENTSLRERVRQQDEELLQKDRTFKELEGKLDLMGKRVEQAEREKDAAVMRYASVECAAIEAKRAAEKAQEKEKCALTEMELLNNKLKSAHSEKARICQLYDDKCHELSNSERELAKLREDMKELEGRLKWTQSKLRMEIDAYKERAERAEKLEKKVLELEQAKEAAALTATDCGRLKHIEQELKESQAALILCRHEKAELEKRLSSTSHQLDSCKRERDSNSTALATALADIEKLKESNLRLEEEAAELAALRAQAALADTLSAQLARETERASLAEEALSRERARAETCARREAAALEHAARLTAQHVQQRATTTDHELKSQALCMENASLRERTASLEGEVLALKTALSEETERRTNETRALARKVAELREEAADASTKLQWEQGELAVLKKKHANAIKELNRELQRALRRCEQLEAKLPTNDHGSTRTGSVSSLSSGEIAPTHTHPEDTHTLQNGHTDTLPDIQVREPDRQALIERIVALQGAAARRAERCDFLEEHARQLTAELRGKSKLLRHLLCSLPAGAVASSHSDAHKKEIARLGGGAMAAVWGGSTEGMTLELSLEMNTKLQAVLEDALLKNITLKENLDTLGEEIARLKQQKNAITDNNTK